MLTGTEVGKILGPLLGLEREKAILQIFQGQGLARNAGGGPWRRIVSTATIDKKLRRLEIDVSPLPAALGTEDDFLVIPAWPWTYQTIANATGTLIPTLKVCTLVAQQADFRVPPITISPNSEATELYVKSQMILNEDLKDPKYKPGMLVASPKKDVNTAPNLDGSHVAISGWYYQPGPQTANKKGMIQDFSTLHIAQYGPDYSHSWRVTRRLGLLDDRVVDLVDVAKDDRLSVLVSDQGPLIWSFPSIGSTGPGALAKVGTGASLVGGAVGGAAVGFIVGGPVGAMVGGLIGGALGRHA